MNVLVTGAAGYLGSNLLKKLIEMSNVKEAQWNIIAADIRDISIKDDCIQFVHLDVRSEQMSEVMKQYEIETVVHLASIVTPGKKSNREFEYAVDVKGTENVLKACVENKVKRIVLTSSGAAYGYHRDNAEWITEDHPIRGNEAFAYAHHKRLVEERLSQYREQHPELEQVIFRVGTILGKSTNNQITSLFEKKMLVGIHGSKSPFVFIWDQDVVACLIKGIVDKQTGIFNVAGDGALTITDVAHILNKKILWIPSWLLKSILFILKRLSLTQYGEEQVNFLRYRPVLDNYKLKHEFGYTPKLTSMQVFQYFLEQKHNTK
ncbi:SDR family oxidoreductase [Longirhabdus pacifica]|uniref:SDR family oxidoreductase n=1 Tax=Longirhabdus pacifica TaxID=2305227 RepID=UPI0010093BC4|nr:SDR family oxidoreductase [Longirhabdus pacifica]